ncbi:PAS domain-containing protein [Dechloromonas sp. ZS-1]|uniref:PAS domain-containing protein n=1 Tax=Dechloromonas sp. ZS-1 TaxID=3138067 RepID=UPI0031FD5CB2
MKDKTIVPNGRERQMRAHDFIVSKTDPKGRITYGNPIFFEFSGYSEEELLGVQHNVIRHPEMPRSAFAFLWATIQQGREFHAYVKNLAKDGSSYWVFANVTPDFDRAGNIIGYFSVRRAPRPEAIQAVTPLYAAMCKAEARAGARDAIEAGTAVLTQLLADKGLSYDELVLAL